MDIFKTLNPVVQNNERVLTTAQLAEFYGCTVKRISENFNRNKLHFIEGKHYFCLEGEALENFKSNCSANCGTVRVRTRILYLWTKQGTARHAKMLGTDKAWDVFEALEENYFAPKVQVAMTNDEIMSRALVLAHETLARIVHEKEALVKEIAELKPKATYHDLVLACPEVVPISVIAQDYGLSARRMNALIHKLGVQYKKGNLWYLYNAYAGKGYTQSKTYATEEADGEKHAHVHMYWTQKGRFFLYELLREQGILPVIEQEALSA